MSISTSPARKPQADGRVQLPPPAAATQQPKQPGGKNDATTCRVSSWG